MRFIKRKEKDNGSVSFALLGVLLILLSIIALGYISRVERLNYENELKTDRISELESLASDTIETIKSKIHYLTIQSVFEGKKSSSNVSSIFNKKIDRYFKNKIEKNGWKKGQKIVILEEEGYNFSLEKNIQFVEEEVQDIKENGKFDKIDNEYAGYYKKRNRSFNYKVKGDLRLKCKNLVTDNKIIKNKECDFTVDIPYPFLRRKLDDFKSSTRGKQSHISRITNYILSTLAQYRTLMGYGRDDKKTSEIITSKDVEIAVNFALILEIAYKYRSVDNNQIKKFSERLNDNTDKRIRRIIYNYLEKGTIDPADITSLFYRYSYDNKIKEKEDVHKIDFSSIISQSINTLVDQFILKYLDKMGLMEVTNTIFKGYQKISDIADSAGETWDGLVSWVTDEGDGDINPKQVEMVKNWVYKTFISSGISGVSLIKSNYSPYSKIDGDKKIGYPNLPSYYSLDLSLRYVTKLISQNHSWFKHSCSHEKIHRKKEETCNKIIKIGTDSDGKSVYGKCGAREEIVGYDYLTKDCNVKINSGPISFRPVDILNNNDELWQEFYDKTYKQETEKDIENIRKTVESIIDEIVDSVLQDKELKETLQKYNKVKIDVRDDKSLFEDIKENVNLAISETIGHYRNNPEKITNIIHRYLQGDRSPKIEELKDFLTKNYNELVDKKRFINNTAKRTANFLVGGSSTYLDYLITNTNQTIGGTNERCDFSSLDSSKPSKEKISHLIKYGGVLSCKKIDYIIKDIIPEVEQAYEEIRNREIKELDNSKEHSSKDGLIIQALDAYQFNKTIKDNIDIKTKGGENKVWIESITPDPATLDKDNISFIGRSLINHTSAKWISNIDGNLSNNLQFNYSANYLTPGIHEIKLSVMDTNGTYHNDTEELFINCPPEAKIGDIDPRPGGEREEITFYDSSTDPEGKIESIKWNMGNGTIKYGQSINHVYTKPGNYTINLTVTDGEGVKDYDETTIFIDEAPYISNISPKPSDGWKTNQQIYINFSESVDTSSLSYTIEPYISLNTKWIDNTSLILSPNNYYDRETCYTLQIRDIKDIDDGFNTSLLTKEEISFSTEKRAKVNDWFPGDIEEVKIQSSIVLTLEESAYITSNVNEFVLDNRDWQASWGENNKHLRLDHTPFNPGKSIKLKFDLNKLRSKFDDSQLEYNNEDVMEIQFKTESVRRPKILSLDPSNSSKDVLLKDDIEIIFNEPINRTSFELLSKPVLQKVKYEWSLGDRKVTIKHEGFESSQKYRIFIEAYDLEGYPLLGQNNVNPFEIQTVGIIHSNIVDIYPRDNTNHVLADSPITISFSERMNKNTLDFRCSPNPGGWDSIWNKERTIVHLFHNDFCSDTHYRFEIESIKDLNGNQYYGFYSSFDISANSRSIEANLFQKKVFSFIGGNDISDSLFDITQSFLETTVSKMITSGKIGNNIIKLPVNIDEGFSYGINDSKELNLLVDFNPDYLDITENIKISNPTGRHFTSLTDISSRPFETTWDISIPSTDISINISKEKPYIIKDRKIARLSVNETFNLSFNTSICVSSGWGLKGVDYSVDRLQLKDILHFMNEVWELMNKPISYIIDGLQKIVELFSNIVEKLKDYATQIVELIGRLVKKLINQLIKPVIDNTELITDNLKNFEKVLSIFGLDLGVKVFENGKLFQPYNSEKYAHKFVQMSLQLGVLGTCMNFDVYILKNNIIANGNLSVNDLRLRWQLDPKAETRNRIYPGWFSCQGNSGEKGDGALLNLTIPEIRSRKDKEKKYEISAADYIPVLSTVSIPIGPVVVSDFDLGLELTYLDIKNSSKALFSGALKNAFWNTVDNMEGRSINLKYIIKFVKILVSKFVDKLINLTREIVKSLVFYFHCMINGVDVVLNFGLASGGSIVDFILWIGQEIKNMIKGFSNKKPVCSDNNLPMSVIEDTEMGIEFGFEEYKAFFTANVPALTSLANKDLGDWRINFGIEMDNKNKLVNGYLEEW